MNFYYTVKDHSVCSIKTFQTKIIWFIVLAILNVFFIIIIFFFFFKVIIIYCCFQSLNDNTILSHPPRWPTERKVLFNVWRESPYRFFFFVLYILNVNKFWKKFKLDQIFGVKYWFFRSVNKIKYVFLYICCWIVYI